MQVKYDKNLKIAGIGMSPWSLIVPARWFNNYKIASLYNWDVRGSDIEIHSIMEDVTSPHNLPKFNTASLLDDPRFRQLINNDLYGYDIIASKVSNKGIEDYPDRKFLRIDSRLSSLLEDKAHSRELLSDSVPFPPFNTYTLGELKEEGSYDKVMNSRKAVVLQLAISSGSKGTFFIRNESDYEKVLGSLDKPADVKVVISSLIEDPIELSVQCCSTKYGVFIGPQQYQIIANPELVNIELSNHEKFSGGVIDPSANQTYEEVRRLAEVIGEKVKELGYKGIFGIDFLVSSDGQIYVTEINARPTGLTSLLNSLYTGSDSLPTYLLHILELGGYDYEISGIEDSGLKQGGSLLIIHSFSDQPVQVMAVPSSGTYKLENSELKQISSNIDINRLGEHEFIIEAYFPPGARIIPGGRVVNLLFKGIVIDKTKKVLYNDIVNIVKTVKQNIYLN